MKKAMVVLLVLCMACSGAPAQAMDDTMLRTAFWVSSGVSASWVSHQQAAELELTPEQKRQIKPRFVGKSGGIEQFESVESCVLGEDDDPGWLEGGAE